MVAAKLESVAVRYRNGARGVTDVNFQVEEGQIVALFGANGAGKTTSARALSGFLRSERAVVSGTVSLFGTDVRGAEPHQTARLGLGFVPERDKVFSALSVADNLRALGSIPAGRDFDHRLDHVLDLFPILSSRLRQQAGRLSGGQQQMLAIARVLLREPKVLIIDELTLGLHHSFHWPLFEALKDVAAGGTSVIVIDESTGFALQVADYCYLLGGGVVRDEGPSEKFRGNELLAAGYLES